MPIYRTTRLISSVSGMPYPAITECLVGEKTRHDVISKRLISLGANCIRNVVLGQAIRDSGCSVRIFSRRLALRLPQFHGMHRFIGPLLLRRAAD